MARVCVVGSVNLDQSFTVFTLPGPGETVLASSTSHSPGGKGGNQAVAAARAGARVDLVAALGDDAAADQLRAHLRTNGVELDGTVTVPGPSGATVIVVDAAAENTIVVAPGANAHLSMAAAVARSAIASADAYPTHRDAESLAQVADVVVVNETESREWRWQVPHLVVTSGADGATYRGQEQNFTVPAPPVEAIDTTGAGDVFAGVLAAEWLSGPENALPPACAAGALATLTPGAGDCAPTAEAIDDVLDAE